jgi:hypothetical protein
VRADPRQPGLLYAGTERGVWVSFDDGASWRSLRYNLPATSVRDLIVHGDDIDIATHGRGFWILDDITPLRQTAALAARAPTLLQPTVTWRVMRDTYTDTPLPPDEPFFANAPAGAYLDYVLPRAARYVSLTIADAHGTVVRQLSSDDPLTYPVDPLTLDIPAWWLAPPTRPSADAGAHRFVWDLHLPAPASGYYGPTIAAIPGGTPLEPQGPRIPPGTYTVTLEADGTRSSRTLVVREDPRAAVTTAQLDAQFVLSQAIEADADATFLAAHAVSKRDATLARDLTRASGGLVQLLMAVESADAAPTATQRALYATQHAAAAALLAKAK